MSRVMRKPTFCICENKDADQLRGNREADQRLCFRYIDSTIPLLSNFEISNKNIKMSSFKSSENIQKKEDGPDRSVSDNQSSSVTPESTGNESQEKYCNFEFQQGSHTLTDINLNGVQITKTV